MKGPGRRLARAAGVLGSRASACWSRRPTVALSPGCDETADCAGAESDGAIPFEDAEAPDAGLGAPVLAPDATPALDAGSPGPAEASTPTPDGSTATGSDASLDAPSTPPACGTIEDCSNGVDDDCNGKVDCADPACQPAFLCASAAPAGWSGPVDLFDADVGAPPACAAPYATLAFDGTADPIAPPATCGCTCSPPSTASCGNVTVSFFFDSSCKNPCAGSPVTVTPGGACVTGCPGALTMRASLPTATGGTCAGNASTSLPPIGWGHTARACAAPMSDAPGGCGAGALCVARPTTPSPSVLCVWRSGDVACPGAPYSVRSVYFTGVNDTRACTACTCDAPGGLTCAASQISTYADGECPSNPAGSIVGDGGCVSAPGSTSVVRAGPSSPSGSGCTPNPVSATGTVVPTGPTTVCCTP